MKQQFFDYLLELMQRHEDVYLLFGGLGWPRIDEFLTKFPERAINCEASEQTMLDVAVGLSYAGKTPFCYTITPFLLRGFETIRTYINKEKLHVVLIGAGRDDDYSKDDGYSHDAQDISAILNTQQHIIQSYPDTKHELQTVLEKSLSSTLPHFISIRR